jgi:predicted DCC family thiol-disulfide oxidoreductase YuxK
VKALSGYQFATFRILFGTYLVLHFVALVPYGPELFSHAGVLPDARLNFTSGIFPNPLARWDSPQFVTAFLVALAVLAVAFMAGSYRRTAAVLLWFGWACLFNRNNLIGNPSIPYVGLLLLLTALVPAGEPLRVGRRADAWVFLTAPFWTAWVLMAVGYSYSGVVKLASPSWVDGTAILHLVNNPLARPGVFRDLFLAAPAGVHAAFTWGTLAAEALFLPASLFRRTRPLAWAAMLSLHLGILSMVAFADLSFGMVMLHLFTFDPDWLPARRGRSALVLYDGVCGLCDRVVQLLLGEDREGLLRFAPLQGETARAFTGAPDALDPTLGTIVFVSERATGARATFMRSEAVLRILDTLGGFWRVVSWLRVVPRPLRDAVYDWVARHRYAWFGRYAECPVPASGMRARFLA